MSDDFAIGDHWMISDISGLKFRASEMRRQWDGKLVHKSEWEPRHPQELVKPRAREKAPRATRPRPLDSFTGPLHAKIAVAAEAGAERLTLDSAERMAAEDMITVMLDNKDVFLVEIAAVYDSTDIQIVNPLPCSVSVGNDVIDQTAMNIPSL